MNSSAETDKIMAALAAFQGEITPPPKNRTVDTGKFAFSYAELDTILEHIKVPFRKYGFGWTSQVEYYDNKAPMLLTRVFHTSGQWIETPYRLTNTNDPKTFAGEVTYGRRYCFSMLMGLSSQQDADEMRAQNQGNGQNQRQPQQRPPQQNQRAPQGAAPQGERNAQRPAQTPQPTNGHNVGAQHAGSTTGSNGKASASPAPSPEKPATSAANTASPASSHPQCTQADLDKLMALVNDQARFNVWTPAQLSEYMAAKYKRARLSAYNRSEYKELYEVVDCLSFNQAMELVEKADKPLPDGDPEPSEPGAEG